jgi:hypothetical protein
MGVLGALVLEHHLAIGVSARLFRRHRRGSQSCADGGIPYSWGPPGVRRRAQQAASGTSDACMRCVPKRGFSLPLLHRLVHLRGRIPSLAWGRFPERAKGGTYWPSLLHPPTSENRSREARRTPESLFGTTFGMTFGTLAYRLVRQEKRLGACSGATYRGPQQILPGSPTSLFARLPDARDANPHK